MTDSLPDPIEVAARIEQCRTELGLSQGGLAKQLGVQRKTVWTWEKGAVVPTTHLPALALVLRRSPQWLLYGVEPIEHELAEMRREIAELRKAVRALVREQQKITQQLSQRSA